MTGRVPTRRAGDGAMPVPGATGAYDWTGFASGAALPHITDPPSGRLVNANNRINLPGFPVFLARDSFGPWRARRIRQMLAADPRATPAAFAAMQADALSTFAEQVLPVLLGVTPAQGAPARAFDLLRHWNGSMARDLPQPLIFNAWLRRFRALVFARLGVPDNGAAPGPEFLAGVLAHGGISTWCGPDPASAVARNGDCAPLLATALSQAVAALAARYGPGPSAWRWGRAHPAIFVDPVLARLPLLGWLTACRIATPGDDTTVDRGAPAGRDAPALYGFQKRPGRRIPRGLRPRGPRSELLHDGPGPIRRSLLAPRLRPRPPLARRHHLHARPQPGPCCRDDPPAALSPARSFVPPLARAR